jgi:hypothetical protein
MAEKCIMAGHGGSRAAKPRVDVRAVQHPAAGARYPNPFEKGDVCMYIIRETFVAKPGMASKLAKLFKEAVASNHRMKIRILTDMVAEFNCVVMESEVSSVAEFEKSMAEYAKDKDMHARMKGYTDMYISGRREIYQVL